MKLPGFGRRAPAAAAASSAERRGWQASRFDAGVPSAQRRWPWWGAGVLVGALFTLLVHAPASWLAHAVAQATDQRVLLADAGGSVWSGNAILVLTGGSGSRDASALPGRLRWTLGLARENRLKLELRLRHACCIDDQLRLRLEPGIGRWRVSLPAGRMAVGHWPASWLSGLGTPFNSLQLGGWMNVASDGFAVESVQGRWRVSGHAEIDLNGVSSRLSPLDTLGSYRLVLGAGSAGGAPGADGAELRLATLQGPLRLSGSGQWVGGRLRFRGEARADAGSEAMLNNLLNIIGRRQGALAVLAIG